MIRVLYVPDFQSSQCYAKIQWKPPSLEQPSPAKASVRFTIYFVNQGDVPFTIQAPETVLQFGLNLKMTPTTVERSQERNRGIGVRGNIALCCAPARAYTNRIDSS
jgi:hypothetical protein